MDPTVGDIHILLHTYVHIYMYKYQTIICDQLDDHPAECWIMYVGKYVLTMYLLCSKLSTKNKFGLSIMNYELNINPNQSVFYEVSPESHLLTIYIHMYIWHTCKADFTRKISHTGRSLFKNIPSLQSKQSKISNCLIWYVFTCLFKYKNEKLCIYLGELQLIYLQLSMYLIHEAE